MFGNRKRGIAKEKIKNFLNCKFKPVFTVKECKGGKNEKEGKYVHFSQCQKAQ